MKKIITAIVAALAASAIAVAPAAAVPTITVAGGVSAGNTAATAFTATVPADNKVDAADAVRFALTGLDAGTTVVASASNAFIVPRLHAVDAPVNALSGVSSYMVNTGTGTTAEFYVYSRSTSVGSVSVTIAGNTSVYYVRGTTSTANAFTVSASTTATTGSTATVTVLVSDVFGNPVAVTPSVTAFNAVAGAVVADAVTGKYTVAVTYPSVAGKSALGFSVNTVDANGLPAPKSTSVFVDVVDLSVENAKLKADLAAANSALLAEKSAHDATKKALADTKASLDVATAKVSSLEATVATLRLWISKLKALVKSLR